MDIRTLPTHPGTGLTAIGWRRNGDPIWPIAGAADNAGDDGEGGDDDAGDGDEGDDDVEGDEEGDGEPAWTPPTKEEWEAQQAKLKRANAQAKKLREERAATTPPAPVKAAPAKVAKKAAPPAPEPEEAPVDTGELERWQVRAVRADAKSALIGRGCDPKMVNLALGQLNPAEVDWNGDDPVLDDWLDQMEEDYPALFAKPAAPAKAAPRKAPSIDQGAASNGGNQARQRPPFGQILIEAGGGLDNTGRLRRR